MGSVLKFQESSRDELFNDIIQSLEILPEVLREVFVRSHYQGQSNSEISRELAIAEPSIPALLNDANEIFYRNLHRFHG